MRTAILLLSFIVLLAGCKSDGKQTFESINKPADVNFYLQSDKKIDSVLFANFTQDREFHFVPYADTLNFTLNDSINDNYFVKFFYGDQAIMHPMWLDGKNLVIKGKITDKFRPDTVIGSSLYYHVLDFRKKFKALIENSAGADSINNFLFNSLQQNISSPFSELIGISIDQDQAEWKKFIKEKNYYWQNLREVDEYDKKLRNNLLITVFPTYLLLDEAGNILYRSNSFEEIEKHL